MIKSSANRIRQIAHSCHCRRSSEHEDSDSDDDETFWYICGTCNQAFQEERKVKKHWKRIHSTKSGQIIFLTDKQLRPQIILKQSSLEDNILNGGDGSAQLTEAKCEEEVRKRPSRADQQFHSAEAESDPLALENSITRLKRKWSSKRQSQVDTSTNDVVTDTQPELRVVPRIFTEGDCLPRGGSTDAAAAAETLPPSPRLELAKKITSSNNSHLLIITQNELLPRVKLVRCERTAAIHPAVSSVSSIMVERNNENDSKKDTCSGDESNDSKGLKKRKSRGRPKKDQQELRPAGEDREASVASLGDKQNFSSVTINSNSNAHLIKMEACCISPTGKVASNVETSDLKIEGYTLAEAEELNSLEFTEHIDNIPDNNDDDWFINSSDSPSPSPQPELVPLSRDKPLLVSASAIVQQQLNREESHNLDLDYHRVDLELEEHKRYEQEIRIVANDEYVKEERDGDDDDNRGRNLRPRRKEGQGGDSYDKIEDPYLENNEQSEDDDEDEIDQDYEDEDSSSDAAESTSSCEIQRKKRTTATATTPSSSSSSTSTTSRKNENVTDTTTSPKKVKKVTVKKETNKEKEKKPKEEEATEHTCQLCGQIYQQVGRFVTHMKTVHQQQVQLATHEKHFPCTLCERNYKNKRDLKRHLLNHKWIASGQGSCTICQQSFNSKTSLTYHMGTYHHSTTTTTTTTAAELLFLCSFCGLGFPTQLNLSAHTTNKHRDKVFKCKVEGCGASFKTGSSWNRHNVSHTGAKPYKCSDPACSQAFKTKERMKLHFKSVHQPHLRPYKCPECPKTYKKSTHMKKHHKATHLGIKVSFKCETCEKSFSRKAPLQTHQLEEHGKPLEKVFECQVCKKQLASPEQLKRHERIHATSLAYQCTTCGKGFKLSSNLATHLASHLSEEEKKWSCQICGKKFALPHHLRQHASAHGGGGGDGGRSRSRPKKVIYSDERIQDSGHHDSS